MSKGSMCNEDPNIVHNLIVYGIEYMVYGIWYIPAPANVPLLRALWALLDGIWGVLMGSWGVLVYGTEPGLTIRT